MIKAIITDIEGTTTDIHFVHQVLFPYSREKITSFINIHQDKPEVAKELLAAGKLIGDKATLSDIIQQFIEWIDKDVKIAPLKNLQGYIWEEGFLKGDFKGHVYEDAYQNLLKWHQNNIKLYVYSSGSVKAQHLLFQFSAFGDMRYLFEGYFDTQVGGKKEASSYAKIVDTIQIAPKEVLFLSDVIAELDAAKQSGLNTILLNRNHVLFDQNAHTTCLTFNEINLNGK